ncbi:UDP-glucose 4-epimerase GalE [Afifella marina]|uniref:UDP-glucose 4-epimerase n=1 Tax=Afifella marina DSM 2698 TaxID=1120955 RepID=A0A1G5MTQ4_AFIMA|nr:UDP-glucose 4-epimerase GalE [Afifella marina]MBK1621966.1 UDP-glucose 4-epimerase GalE [Afifella marina DSM 2698]MBK1627759.1 UDP-glucose 4-epimerase GalE [Afifella marina]MBK5916726.1 UDP-glucose 4-epimerase GalE [Afifella marina]RAI19945.1 UDP-glucose 4-epimerase GalE [Afifella marina DSM 2698]SCZ28545.1 UDP-glucose 4-epimerase [Afifella marina DSM 2698]
MQATVLVAGGNGYIGSHVVVELARAGYRPVIVDNLANSHPEAARRVGQIAGAEIPLLVGDIRDAAFLDRVFIENPVDVVIHLAGLKAVGESVEKPLAYYDVNVGGAVSLFEAMARHAATRLVFSSSATVYGDPQTVPIEESFPVGGVTNPYGRTKMMIEEIITDTVAADMAWQAISLRYFNPVGAHESALIGEDPMGIPNNLFPYIAQVAVGRREHLRVFGGDYPTHDGTGVRDYIHVVDLARAHVKATEALLSGGVAPGTHRPINLGTGRGYSVLDTVKAWRRATNRPIPYEIVERRAGDIATCYADPKLAAELLGWQADLDLDAMCRDHWRWQSQNPNGYTGD